MKKIGLSLALACMALSVSACATDGVGSGSVVTAPLAGHKFDENALIAADRAFDAALDVINLCTDLKVHVPGVPEHLQPFMPGTDGAKQLASSIRTVDGALNRAAAIAGAANGDPAEYAAALESAKDGIAIIQTILRTRGTE